MRGMRGMRGRGGEGGRAQKANKESRNAPSQKQKPFSGPYASASQRRWRG